MAYYKINLEKLGNINTDLKNERLKLYNKITSLPPSPDSLVAFDITAQITYRLMYAINTILQQYDSITNWLNSYIEAVQEVEQEAISLIGDEDSYQYEFPGFSIADIIISPSPVTPATMAGVAGGIGSIPSEPSGGTGGNTGNGGTPTPEPTVTPTPYDKLFEEMKKIQDTKPLESNISSIEKEIEELEKLLENTTDPTEKEKIKSELDKLYKQLEDAKYELETLLIINGLQNELKKFKTFDEYKAYVESIGSERNELLEKLSSQNKDAAELLNLIINDENYDRSKPIYYYKDEKGIHYSFEEQVNSEKITYEELCQKFNKTDLENFIAKNDEYNKHQRVIEYIESKAK